MALNWSVGQCADWQELVCEKEPDPRGMGAVYVDGSSNEHRNEDRITTHLVFMTCSVGLHRITEKNFKEFYRRAKVVEEAWRDHLHLWLATGNGEEDYRMLKVPLTLDMVERRVGLSTNANGKDSTKKEFEAMMARIASDAA